jgi:hypothetical protein
MYRERLGSELWRPLLLALLLVLIVETLLAASGRARRAHRSGTGRTGAATAEGDAHAHDAGRGPRTAGADAG